MRTILKTAFITALATVAAAPATAAAAAGINVQPRQAGSAVSFFSLAAKPGAALRGNTVVIENPGDRPARVRIVPVEAQTAENLGFAYEIGGGPSGGIARWTRVETPLATVPAHGDAEVPLTTRVPGEADPGDYLTGISVEQLGQQAKAQPREGVEVVSTKRYAIGLLLRVPGPREAKIELTGARVTREPAGTTFHVDAENTGNVLLRDVTGRVTVTRDGRPVASSRLGRGTFVARTSFSYPLLAAAEQPQEGTEYRVQAVFKYGGETARLDEVVAFGEEAAERQEDFGGPSAGDGIGPWPVLAVIAALIAAAGTALIIRRRRRRRRGRWPLLGPGAAAFRLERELHQARASGRPISAVRISTDAQGDDLLPLMVLGVLPRLRAEDAVCDLGHGELMIIAPGLDRVGADRLASALRESPLDPRGPLNGASKIETATGASHFYAAAVIAAAAARAGGAPPSEVSISGG